MRRTEFKRATPKAKPERTRSMPTPIPEHLRRAASYTGTTTAAPKPPEPVRSEAYRRLVAALPCAHCGKPGPSQHAHENAGKAKGRKLDDREAMPLCADGPGYVGCHTRFDQYKLFENREQHIEAGKAWAAQTRAEIERTGWPERVPKY
jgi:hypothetical protein